MNIRRSIITCKGAEIAMRVELGHATTGFVLSIEMDAAMALYLAAGLSGAVREVDGADLATVAASARLEEALRSQPPLPELFPTTSAGSVPVGNQS